MRNYVYFWIEKCLPMDWMSPGSPCLYNDFGVNLSSKYQITHKWSKKERIFSFESCKDNGYMISTLKEGFYSESICDLKVILGNNGTGKSSLISFLADIISGKDSHDSCTYILAWEENGEFRFFLNSGKTIKNIKGKNERIADSVKIQSKMPFKRNKKVNDSVILYSPAFPNYWSNLDFEGQYANCYDIRTRTLLKENVEIANNGLRKGSNKENLLCFSILEENKIVDFVLDFYDVKVNGELFLAKTLALPPVLYFVLSEENINNGIREIADTLKKDKYDEDSIAKEWKTFYNSLFKFDDQIKFACIVNAFRKKIYSIDSRKKIDSSAFTIENIKDLDEFLKQLPVYLRDRNYNQLYSKVERLIKILKPFKQKGWFSLNVFRYRIQINQYKKEIREIREILNELEGVTRIMNLEWGRPLSSGESAYLTFFGRLYSCLKEYKVNIESFYKRNGKEFQGCLFLDEIDLYLHPEWQRMWFDKFIDGLSLIKGKLRFPLKLQLFMASHSPFMATDFSSESILTLQREKFENGEWGSTSVKTNVLQKTMASNIYDVLDSGFILGGTLGCFIERKIKELLKRIEERKITPNDQKFIKQIGDPIIQSIVSNRMRP